MWVCVSMDHMCVGVFRRREKVWDPPELGLQEVASCRVQSGAQPTSSYRAYSAESSLQPQPSQFWRRMFYFLGKLHEDQSSLRPHPQHSTLSET